MARGVDGCAPVDLDSELSRRDTEALSVGPELDRHPGELSGRLFELALGLGRHEPADVHPRYLDHGCDAIGRAREADPNEGDQE